MKRRLKGSLYWPFVRAMRVAVRLCTRCEVRGLENLPKSGPVLLVSNHLHLVDPPLVGAFVPRRVHPMAKRELYETPLIGWIFWAYGAFPVRRFSGDMGALRVARNLLRNGEVVHVFPEGTRAREGRGMRPGLPGAAMVALLARSPIVPLAITGTREIHFRSIFFRWLIGRQPSITLTFGEPFELEAGPADARSAEIATDTVMRRVAAMLPEHYRGAYGPGSEGKIIVVRQGRDRDDPRPPDVHAAPGT